jgi:hypothetical protein
MAKINKRRVRWNPSTAEDTVGYRVYYLIGGGEIDVATAPFKDVATTQVVIPDDIPELANVDGEVAFGIAALDELANESDLLLVSGPFDFAAPDAPTGAVIETVTG